MLENCVYKRGPPNFYYRPGDLEPWIEPSGKKAEGESGTGDEETGMGNEETGTAKADGEGEKKAGGRREGSGRLEVIKLERCDDFGMGMGKERRGGGQDKGEFWDAMRIFQLDDLTIPGSFSFLYFRK